MSFIFVICLLSSEDWYCVSLHRTASQHLTSCVHFRWFLACSIAVPVRCPRCSRLCCFSPSSSERASEMDARRLSQSTQNSDWIKLINFFEKEESGRTRFWPGCHLQCDSCSAGRSKLVRASKLRTSSVGCANRVSPLFRRILDAAGLPLKIDSVRYLWKDKI